MSGWTKREINRWISDMGNEVTKSLSSSREAPSGRAILQSPNSVEEGVSSDRELEEALTALQFLIKYFRKRARQTTSETQQPRYEVQQPPL
jgi:hypothetical protein